MNNNKLLKAMISYYAGDPARIQHFMKVYGFAKMIGEMEGLDAHTQQVLETAAIVHDIGIKPAEKIYKNCDGPLQEKLGPRTAKAMLGTLSYAPDLIERVCDLVGHHHTYTNIDGLDYQILVEADFLVNLYEDGLNPKNIEHAYTKIFRTAAGRELCAEMFGCAKTGTVQHLSQNETIMEEPICSTNAE